MKKFPKRTGARTQTRACQDASINTHRKEVCEDKCLSWGSSVGTQIDKCPSWGASVGTQSPDKCPKRCEDKCPKSQVQCHGLRRGLSVVAQRHLREDNSIHRKHVWMKLERLSVNNKRVEGVMRILVDEDGQPLFKKDMFGNVVSL